MEIAIVVRYFVESEVDNTAPYPPGMLMSHPHNTALGFTHGYKSILFDYLWYVNVPHSQYLGILGLRYGLQSIPHLFLF